MSASLIGRHLVLIPTKSWVVSPYRPPPLSRSLSLSPRSLLYSSGVLTIAPAISSCLLFLRRQVTHEAGAFEAGDSVILTLKDQALLEEDEHGRVTGLKDDDDELENVHMKEAEVRCGGTPLWYKRDLLL